MGGHLSETMEGAIENKVVLITGGTGSFGKAMVQHLLEQGKPRRIRIFSRDELKQYEMAQQFPSDKLRFFIGDVRDRDRLRRACQDVDIVLHAAALKQVPACEYNPFEAVQTNIIGAMNVVEAAIDCNVKRAICISTDKAVSPVNLYGATKLCAEKLFIHGNSYSGQKLPRFACVRYGNVMGSRGSVLPLFLKQRKAGTLSITHKDMTRFWLSLDQAVRFVCLSLTNMVGGEIFVPRIPSMRITDLAKAVAPESDLKVIGIRPGEKLHETLLMQEEARHTLDMGDYFIVVPERFPTKVKRPYEGKKLPTNYSYSSDTNDSWLSTEAMQAAISEIEES
jgi:UDP-N-acetylglucosamine 4,6-dehydratase